MSLTPAPKLRELQVRAVRVPLEHPHKTASGEVSESPLVLTDAIIDDGTVGHSVVFTYTSAALKPTADLILNFEALIKDDTLAPAEIEQKLAKRFRLLGPQGLVGIALAAIDMALWDALARTYHTSLVRLLGGVEKPIPAYGAVGYDGIEGSAQVAEEWARRGFKGVKAKIGYPTVQEDVAVIRAMRQAVGDDLAIMVDYNQCLTPVEAVQRLKILDEEGLTWVEEPTLAHDYAGHALVAREARTPIQCGENWWGCLDLQHALDVQASDFMMPDVMKIGGVTGWLRAAALELGADMWELDVSVTADGALVVLHDDSLARTTNVQTIFPQRAPWLMAHFTLAEIKTLDAGSWFVETDPFGTIADGTVTSAEQNAWRGQSIPTLREALTFTREQQWRVNVEIKELFPPLETFPVVEAVIDLIEALDMVDQVLLSSFAHAYMQQAKSLNPALAVAALLDVGEPIIFQEDKLITFEAIHPHYTSVDVEKTQALRQAGVAINPWTVNDPAEMERLIQAGVTGIITDFPQIFKQVGGSKWQV